MPCESIGGSTCSVRSTNSGPLCAAARLSAEILQVPLVECLPTGGFLLCGWLYQSVHYLTILCCGLPPQRSSVHTAKSTFAALCPARGLVLHRPLPIPSPSPPHSRPSLLLTHSRPYLAHPLAIPLQFALPPIAALLEADPSEYRDDDEEDTEFDRAFRSGVRYLKSLGLTDKVQLIRVLDLCMNPFS